VRPDLPASALGAVVRAKRLQRGLSEAELAARSGLHVTYIGGLERGRRDAGWNALTAVAAGLDTRLSELVAEAERCASR
jgi:transcriptional regulator with XRE-family HTH domain